MTVEPGRPTSTAHRWWSLAAGAIFAAVALLAAPLVRAQFSGLFDNDRGRATWLTYGLGVFLTGVLFWWLMVGRPRRVSWQRGAITGVVVALFSYPVVFFIAEIFQRNWDSVADPVVLLERLIGVLFLTALTLLTTGFAATLLMAAAGALSAVALMRLFPETATGGARDGGLLTALFKGVATLALIVVAALVGVFVWLSLAPFAPLDPTRLHPRIAPALSYGESLATFAAIEAEEAALPLDRRCASKLLTHGRKTERVAIYFHGFTNCPAQGDILAEQLFARGYNVYLPRFAYHGEADTMTTALSQLTAEDLANAANDAVDLARGLGDEVSVAGLSGGGTVALWVAQTRPDVVTSVTISPFLGPYGIPPWANHAAANLLLTFPNLMVWWDSSERASPPGMEYAYARYATHGLAQFMRLGGLLEAKVHAGPPAVPNLGALLNDADGSVSNTLTEDIIAVWRAAGRDVVVEILPEQAGLPHDLIDPHQPEADIDLVYPMVVDLLAGTAR